MDEQRSSGEQSAPGPRAGEPQPHGALGRTEAVVRRSRWPGWIWLVPVAAVAILAWLGVRYFFTHGAEVTLYFDKAPGVSAQNTQVTYRGVQIGEVSNVALTEDGSHVRVELKLDKSMDKYLRSGTRFWLQSLSSDLADLPSLMSAIAGPTVMMEPGPGRPQHIFTGLAQAPAFPTPTAGTVFTLMADTHGSAQQGSSVYYLGLKVGKVLSVRFIPPHRFRSEVLIQSPYDQLVHADTRFWDAGALELSFTNGLKLQLLSPSALLEGAIAFTTPARAAGELRSPPGQTFTLYEDQASATLAPSGPHTLYTIELPGAVGGLKVGAAVKLRDFVVGEVRDVGFDFDARTGEIRTPVRVQLDAERLRLPGTKPGGAPPIDDVLRLQAIVARLVHAGLHARLAQDPPLIGAYYVSLDMVPGARPGALDRRTDPPAIPAAPGGGLSAFTTKLGDLPIQQIGDNVREITERLRMLASSDKTRQSLQHLSDTLSNVDRIVQQAKPQVQPLIANLRRASAQLDGLAGTVHQALGGPDEQGGLDQTLDEVTRAARSVRSLADYLERHPAALIRGKQR